MLDYTVRYVEILQFCMSHTTTWPDYINVMESRSMHILVLVLMCIKIIIPGCIRVGDLVMSSECSNTSAKLNIKHLPIRTGF